MNPFDRLALPLAGFLGSPVSILLLLLLLGLGLGQPARCVAQQPSGVPAGAAFRPIFNGRDLTGWDGDRRLWSVRDGAIRGETTESRRARGNTFLIWKGGRLRDFELRLSFRCSSSNNSGIQYRSRHVTDPNVPNPWVVQGYQHEIRNSTRLPSVAGFLYEERGKRGRMCLVGQRVIWTETGEKRVTGQLIDQAAYEKLFRLDDWNDVAIIARGNRLRHYLNGRLILDCIDRHPQWSRREGILALQIHAGKPMWVEFKNIRLRTFD